ncbi:MAG TPA: TRAP transporter substrate-binding protein DctP [Pseudolabrys sp.]|nr:TRAP transporter substrate-binding protein DctP [Pseudolabrys sp.]
MTVNRRGFLRGAGAVTAAVVTGAPYIARGAGKVQLTVANGSPLKHVLSAQGTTPWIERVKALTNGEVEIKYFPAGQVAQLKELLRAVQNGVADIAPIPMGYVTDKMPLNDVSALPGLGSTSKAIVDAHAAALKGGLLAKEFAANHIHPLYVMAFPPYQVVSMTTPIKTLADFKGRVLRSAGGGMNLAIKALGATPAEIPVGEMYLAMQRGTVDGTISAFASVKGYNVQDIAKSMSANASFGTFINILSCNAERWKTLPQDIQAALTRAGTEINVSAAAFLDGETGKLEAEFKAKGMEIYNFAPDQLAAINGKLASVQDEWVQRLAARGLPAAEALKQYRSLVKAG